MSSTSDSHMEGSRHLRFDETNIRQTNHPVEKDYGLMSIPESKTPFPRHADPVEAKELHRRLHEAIEQANMRLSANDDDDASTTDSMSVDASPGDSSPLENSNIERERRHSEFLRKRKQFYQSEFLITRQKRLCGELHPPGPSVGNNWRIDEGDDNYSASPISAAPPRITSIISRNRLPHPGSLVNQETLREIAEHMSRSRTMFPNN